jgi:hypothetical protein
VKLPSLAVNDRIDRVSLLRVLARCAPGGLPRAEPGAAIEVDRAVSKDGHVSLGGRYYIAAEILGGMLVSIRIEQNTLRPSFEC